MNWDDLIWLRDQWPGPLLVKGVLDSEDAEHCAGLGADALIVSNHGGRQLDGVPAAIDALPAVVDRVGDRLDVLVDGRIRSGRDVIVALALRARTCLVGRPLMYGLGGGGTEGASDVLRILTEELRRNLRLMGLGSVKDVDRSALVARAADARI